MAGQIKRDSVEGRSLHTLYIYYINNQATPTCSLLKGKSLLWFCCQSLALFVGILLLSESVTATPTQFSPLSKGGWGGSPSLAQQPATSSPNATTTDEQQVYARGRQLFEQARQLQKQGTAEQRQQALAKYEEALLIWQQLAVNEAPPYVARNVEASILLSIGTIYSIQEEPQKALNYFNRGLALRREMKNRLQDALARASADNAGSNSNDKQKLLDTYKQALASSNYQEATQLYSLGSVYSELGENQKALESYNHALSLFRAEKKPLSEATVLRSIANLYFQSGETKKALDFYNQALDFYNQARSLYQKAGWRAGEAAILSNISKTYEQLGEMQKALDALNQALVLCRAISQPDSEAFTLSKIADIYISMGEPQKALDFYNQALNIQRQVNAPTEQAKTLYSIAEVYSSLGDYQLSIDTHNQALEIFKRIGDHNWQALTLNEIGRIYRQAKDYQKALEFHNQVLELVKQNNLFLGQVNALTSIAGDYLFLKDYAKALDAANQMLALSRKQNKPFWEAQSFVTSGNVYWASGDYPKALEAMQKAATGHQKIGYRLGEANALYGLGKIYNALKQYEKALSTYDRDLELRRMLGDRTGEAETYYNAAITQRDKGNLNEARTQIEAAISIVEDIRTQVTSQELRTSYFASVQNYYQFYIDVLMQLHKKDPSKGYDALALHASERARARSLLELLTEANANIRQGVDATLLERERTLQQRLDAFEKRRLELVNGKDIEAQVQALEKQTAELLEEYRQVQEQIRRTNPRYANLKYPQPLTLQQIQSTVLDDNTVLLEYSLGEERSYLWAVTKTTITSYELPKRADIEAVAQRFYKLLKTPGYNLRGQDAGIELVPTDTTGAVAQLSQILLAPVAQQLGNKRLLIVSDGALQYVPFSALPVPGTSGENVVPLLVNHEIINLPSASTLAVIREDLGDRKPAPKTVAVLADPVFSTNDERLKTPVGARHAVPLQPATPNDVDTRALSRAARENSLTFKRLPFTRTEADSILKLASTAEAMQAFDFTANRATATNPQLSQYKIVHFATHGILNSLHPELSGVVLSLVDKQGQPQNGFLRLNDIFNLNLPAELVVLSACETGLGQDVKGEGLVGLTRGFMYAGAPRVLVSLWSVDDQGTSELMTRFYKKMLQEGLKPAAALRSAQIEMLQNPKWKQPYYWAAFTLQGEWR